MWKAENWKCFARWIYIAGASRIIITEDNSTGSDDSVARHLRRFGYHRAWRTGVNDWYVRFSDLHRFARRRLRLELLRWQWRLERRNITLEKFFAGKDTGFMVQLGLEIGGNPNRSQVLERDEWRGLLVEMDEEKGAPRQKDTEAAGSYFRRDQPGGYTGRIARVAWAGFRLARLFAPHAGDPTRNGAARRRRSVRITLPSPESGPGGQ